MVVLLRESVTLVGIIRIDRISINMRLNELWKELLEPIMAHLEGADFRYHECAGLSL